MDDVLTAVRDPARLEVLRSTGLLDSPVEESFDRLTRQAANALGAPVCLITLVDEDRQFFKSSTGLPEPWAARRETPLSQSFCQFVVSSRQPLIIDDTKQDPRVCNNLARRALGVGAYLGVPLQLPDGTVLGSFCALDTKPRDWSDEDVMALRDFAGMTVELIRCGKAA
jgi:GAF domain-containing protein